MRSKYIIFSILASLSLASCNFLDYDETSGQLTKEDMYMYFSRTKGMLTQVYSYMPQGYEPFSTLNGYSTEDLAMRDCASDDGEFGTTSAAVQYVNNGNWSATRTYDTAWELYNGIRAANGFIIDVANVDLSRYEHDGQYDNWMRQLEYFPYEARVLRAYFFFELARRYGDIAMPLTVLTEAEANSINKTPFNEVISFIVSECDEAAQNLPDSYVSEPSSEVGRITRGFAMAVKSKALLYAASALHNPSMDAELWKTSARAAQDIIKSGLYQLDPNLVDATTGNTYSTILNSPEVVLMRSNSASNTFELYNFPLSYTNGQRTGTSISDTNFPSQNLVDAFETVNGYAVTLGDNGWECEDPAFDPQAPYDNRDPRFYRSVLTNGMTFKERTIETFEGGNDYYSSVTDGATPTGYFLRRYIDETTSFETGAAVTTQHVWAIYRYAETLLAYAESMVNAFGDPEYTDGEFTLSARAALNQVRRNAGMPDVAPCSSAEFLQRLYNEWRVEFAFEDHRFWDVRRWKIGSDTQRQLYGLRIVREDDGTYTYYRNLYETRTWNDRMYLYPIPQDELYKNTNLNPQNTGW